MSETAIDQLEAAEKYTRDVLRIFGQHDDAENDKLVRQIALKVLRAVPGRHVTDKGPKP